MGEWPEKQAKPARQEHGGKGEVCLNSAKAHSILPKTAENAILIHNFGLQRLHSTACEISGLG
jgi:hypothetical protein